MDWIVEFYQVCYWRLLWLAWTIFQTLRETSCGTPPSTPRLSAIVLYNVTCKISTCSIEIISGFHLENCPRGNNWRDLDFKGLGGGRGGMMVKDVTKFHKRHLGVWVCFVCVHGFTRNFEFCVEGTPKFGVGVEGVYST